jgi:hypothetical protein
MIDDYERTYFEIWGEMPPKSGAESSADDQALLVQPVIPAATNGLMHDRPPPAPPSPNDLDRKANEVIQRMMVETLRRLEARIAVMDERDRSISTEPSGVGALYEKLTNLADEMSRFLYRTRKVNEDLAGLQIESARNLELIAKKIKDLENRPLHWPRH